MKHAYLTEASVNDALTKHLITLTEAKKLLKKIKSQVAIFKTLHK